MRKIWRVFVTALALIIVVGAVASASPSLRSFFGEQHLSTGPTGSTGSDDQSESAKPSQQDTEATGGQDAQAPDYSSCEGLTGLDNAICRHEALLVVHPDNQGLQIALERLEANKAEHGAASHGSPPGSSNTSSTSPGHSGDAHGKSGEPHGRSGDTHGKPGAGSGDSTDTTGEAPTSDGTTGPGNSGGHGNSGGPGNSGS